MARTFFRQAEQIRKSDLFVDNATPAVAMESGAVTLEDDLNNLRSIASLLRDVQTGNWYDDLAAPSTFENGIKRGVQNLNQELHDLERKRVLVEVFNINDIPVGTQATGTLTLSANVANNDTVTTGGKTYTFQTVLTNVDGNVLIGGSASDSLDNLIAAIGLGAGSGTLYAALTTANTFVYADPGAGDTMIASAKQGGVAGNGIATTEVSATASWGGTTLSGGVDTNVAVLARTTWLPSNTIAAIGAVTTRGTVAAAHGGTFGNHSLTFVGGSNALSPKNLSPIVDSVTHDPILSSSRRVWALFHTESVTDGSTITITTPNRAQLSFVRQSAAGTALEAVPTSDLAGRIIHFSAIERKALEDFNEQDFLKGTTLDVPGSTTVTRQVAYDNQGTTPVDLTTNATLDIEGAGLAWRIRDDLQANLFGVVEGSAGGTSRVEVNADVDVFDVEAVINDFSSGIRVATGGQRINVGETAGVIESTGANDLRVLGAAELYLDDGNQTGSTWAQTNGIKLSDTTAEWDAFETAFGEVSLLAGIVAAYNSSSELKTYHNVTVATNEDLDISLAAGNIDIAFPDMSVGSFLNDYDVYYNGQLERPGANSGANNDYYPGSTLTPAAALRFEHKVKVGDVICVVKKA